MAPVTGGVADGEEYRLILRGSQRERFFAPRHPIDGVVGVLQEIGRFLGGEAVL